MAEENIIYSIKEIKKNEVLTSDDIQELHDNLCNINDNDMVVHELDYATNYKVSELNKIMDYYKIPRSRMRKDEIIQTIVLFENEIENQEIVNRRKYLWNCIEELKADDFLSKYIVF